jgi:glutathionylspermidine synthase
VTSAARDSNYLDLAAELVGTGVLSDPWLDGQPRFRSEPVVLTRARAGELCAAAEAVCALHDQVVRLCARDAALRDRFFTLTPFQRLLWESSAPAWHGLARADVFLTANGPQVCELNSDTPSGEAEAVLLNRAAHARHPSLVDPNAAFADRFIDLLEAVGGTVRGASARSLTIGIVYPTELVEDLSMIVLYQRWLEERGHRVVLGSPFNLRRVRGRAALFDQPCDVFLRHYKTDWWTEREPVWLDEDAFADAAPLERELGILLEGVAARTCVVTNPFGAVLTQNKRAMALMWEAMDRFSVDAQAAIRRYVPFTARLEAVPPELLADRRAWVLKSDYGCESAEVVMGCDVTDEEWHACLRLAAPGRFVVQRRFDPIAEPDGDTLNYGVYCIAGRTAGFFTRVDRGATSDRARTAPTFIEEAP